MHGILILNYIFIIIIIYFYIKTYNDLKEAVENNSNYPMKNYPTFEFAEILNQFKLSKECIDALLKFMHTNQNNIPLLPRNMKALDKEWNKIPEHLVSFYYIIYYYCFYF